VVLRRDGRGDGAPCDGRQRAPARHARAADRQPHAAAAAVALRARAAPLDAGACFCCAVFAVLRLTIASCETTIETRTVRQGSPSIPKAFCPQRVRHPPLHRRHTRDLTHGMREARMRIRPAHLRDQLVVLRLRLRLGLPRPSSRQRHRLHPPRAWSQASAAVHLYCQCAHLRRHPMQRGLYQHRHVPGTASPHVRQQ